MKYFLVTAKRTVNAEYVIRVPDDWQPGDPEDNRTVLNVDERDPDDDVWMDETDVHYEPYEADEREVREWDDTYGEANRLWLG
jgi:hypothetical protein